MTTFIQPGMPPAPGYPTAPPQYPAQPAYPPPAPAYPPQQFAPGYPAMPYQPPAPTQPLAQGSIDDFYNQPSTGGGKSLSWQGKPAGTTYIGIVTRPITQGDIEQQTDTQRRPLFFKDNRPKFVMKVPLQMQPLPEFPDGLATWFVKGQARDELVRAMAEVGAPTGPPEANAIIQITLTGTRPSGAGMNPANQFRITYTRPNGAAPAAPQPPAAVPAAPPIPPPPPAAPAAYQQPVQYAAPAAVPAPAAPMAAPAAPAAPVPPPGLTGDQQELLARLTGAQAAQ